MRLKVGDKVWLHRKGNVIETTVSQVSPKWLYIVASRFPFRAGSLQVGRRNLRVMISVHKAKIHAVDAAVVFANKLIDDATKKSRTLNVVRRVPEEPVKLLTVVKMPPVVRSGQHSGLSSADNDLLAFFRGPC